MAVVVKKKKHVNRPALPSGVALDSNAHKTLFTLGQERIDQLTARLVAGEKLTALASLIQNDWKELGDIQEMTLIQQLSRFRKERVDGKLLWLQNTKYAEEAMSAFGKDVDVLDQLVKLVQMQQERVSKAFLREQSLPILMANIKFEIQLLANLYKQLAELQMDLGVVRRVPKEMLIASVEVAASKAGALLEEAISKDKRVGDQLSKAFQLLAGEFEDLVADDAGVFSSAN